MFCSCRKRPGLYNNLGEGTWFIEDSENVEHPIKFCPYCGIRLREQTPYEQAVETATPCNVDYHPPDAHRHGGEAGYFKKG